MSALATIIDAAVSVVVAEHPKLFDPKGKDRAQKLLVREIMKQLTREPKGGDAETDAAPLHVEGGPVLPERISATDERAIAYCNLRVVAGAAAPMRLQGGDIYLPSECDVSCVRPFVHLPAREKWVFVTDAQQLGAWGDFIRDLLPTSARRELMEVRDGKAGIEFPWPWPPSKTGKIYETSPAEEPAI